MAYTPTVWATGDVITAEKLNKAEEGITNAGPYIVRVASYDPETYDAILDASFKDIYDAVSEGRLVMTIDSQSENTATIAFLTSTSYNASILYPYNVAFSDGAQEYMYRAANETDALKQYST